MKKTLLAGLAALVLLINGLVASPAQAYPYFAQEAYKNPREATGRIVCANCHLAQKPIELELPQAVEPNTVFEAVVKIPYDHNKQQVTADGSKAGLNIGAVLMLPEGFKIAPEDRIPEELKEKTQDIYYQPYSDDLENVVIVGPISGDEYSEIVFPVLSPDPATDKSVHFLKYAVHVGGNRGRGQVYPTGQKSNNNQFAAPIAGRISEIAEIPANEDEGIFGGYNVTIKSDEGTTATEKIPAGLARL
jgi:apocytochrome f